MAMVRLLLALRYHVERVRDLSKVIALPHDVISSEDKKRYYGRSPYTIIRVELGEVYPSDSSQDNVYTRAAQTFTQWRLQGILQQEEQVLAAGSAQAILLLNATPLRRICAAAQADHRMPSKSTYLYPKLVTGLVMNPLW